jgi:hypothetical protein
VVSQVLTIKVLPYDTALTNVVSFINEVSVSVYLYLSLLLSDFVQTQSTSIEEIKILEMRQSIGWIITIVICVVVAFNIVAFLIVSAQNLSNFLRTRNERMIKMKDKVVRLSPVPLEFEKSEDVTVANNDESNACGR